VIEWLSNVDRVWQYMSLFILAFAPWIDVFLVIPLGIAWGLSPIWVAIIGFAGNFLTVILLCYFFQKIVTWREKRRIKRGRTSLSKRETRARYIWERYGLPVLSLLAPVAVGTDIAAVLALTFGSLRIRVLGWMALSLALWSIALAIGSAYGFAYMQWI
jgi:uncharacterized membrane protein